MKEIALPNVIEYLAHFLTKMILFSPLSPNSGKINPVLWKKPYISSNYFLCFAGLLVSHLGQIQNLIPIKGFRNGRWWWLEWCVHVCVCDVWMCVHACVHPCVGKSLVIFYLDISNNCQIEILTEFFQ